jgi:hypothetical protein
LLRSVFFVLRSVLRSAFFVLRSTRSLQELGKLLTLAELHIRLLPVIAAPDIAALALQLPLRVGGSDLGHLGAEQLLNRLLDLNLVGGARDFEDHRAAILAEGRGLLGHQRATYHIG